MSYNCCGFPWVIWSANTISSQKKLLYYETNKAHALHKQRKIDERLSISLTNLLWNLRDSNPRPLPCQGSALNQLS
jgi:hypothetical protein